MKPQPVAAAALALLISAAVGASVCVPLRANAQVPSGKTLMVSTGTSNPITAVAMKCSNTNIPFIPMGTIGCSITVSSAKSSCTLVFHSVADGQAALSSIHDTSGLTPSTINCAIDGVLETSIALDTATNSTTTYGKPRNYIYSF